MPSSWTTKEQAELLEAELPEFGAARRKGRGAQFLKGLADRWFERWPEREALFFNTADAPEMALTLEDDERLSAAIVSRMKVSYEMI